jgi:uncharacterized membrane protein YhaH (DUF805 family)
MNFITAIKTVFGKYATFRGVASRPEYWWWTLFSFIVSSVLNQISNLLGGKSANPSGASLAVDGVVFLFAVATFVPSLAVAVRRFHDAGFSGKWMLLGIIPAVAILSVLVSAVGSIVTLTDPSLTSAQIQTMLFSLVGIAVVPVLLSFAVWVFFLVVTLLPSKSAEAGNKHAN